MSQKRRRELLLSARLRVSELEARLLKARKDLARLEEQDER